MILRKLVILIIVIFWPINLILSGNINDIYKKGETIFTKDYETQQKVIRDTRLYNSIFLARLFHNKARIIIDKYIHNFFVLIDPSNYFFGNHPRQLVGGQNLQKFPFLAIIFLVTYLFTAKFDRGDKIALIFVLFASAILSLLKYPESKDFILWLPLSYLIVKGVNKLSVYKISALFFLLFLILASIELGRLYITK